MRRVGFRGGWWPPEREPKAGDRRREEIESVSDPETRDRILAHYLKERRSRGLAPDETAGLGPCFEDERILIRRDAVVFPGGVEGTHLCVFERPSPSGLTGVVVLPLVGRSVILLNVFRHCTRRWELECPRGSLSLGEDAEQAARRELSEETGIAAGELFALGEIAPNDGLLANVTLAFAAVLPEGTEPCSLSVEEAIGGFELLGPERLRKALLEGAIRDGFTLAALQLAQARGVWTP